MISLEGQVAIITGGSRGIGEATAIKFAQAGANVVINYNVSRAAAESVVESARKYGVEAIAVPADVSKFNEVRKLFDETLEKFGRLDILVANAGIWKGAPIEEMTEAQWDETMEINLKSIYACCHLAAGIMKKQRSGKIITISSTAGQRGEAFHSHYAATKGAIISFTKSLATELGPYGINVNSVAPGWVDTDMSAGPLSNKDELAKILELIPLGRVATADDIAGPILFLASDLARHINGEILNVNGGSVLCG